MSQDCPHYENEEIMAQLGRDIIDMLIGQRNKGRSDESIAPTLLAAAARLLEDEEEIEPEDQDEGDDGSEIERDTP